MDRYEATIALISAHPGIAQFADFGHGTPDRRIQEAEQEIGFSLPASYKWWLRHYGGGEVGGEEIYSVYEDASNPAPGGDIVYMHRMHCNSGAHLEHQLVICHSDIDGVFYFDATALDEDGEYPVASAATGRRYASNFLEFLSKRIKLFAG